MIVHHPELRVLALRTPTLAEGIEDDATAASRTEMDCGVAQGYHFARPMPLADVTAWLDSAAACGRLHV